MATLTVIPAVRIGAAFALVAATAGGDEFANTGKECLVIANGATHDPLTVTLDIEATIDGAAVTDPTVSVPLNTQMVIGPFPTAQYNNSATGRVSVTYSGVTAVTVGVAQITKVQ